MHAFPRTPNAGIEKKTHERSIGVLANQKQRRGKKKHRNRIEKRVWNIGKSVIRH